MRWHERVASVQAKKIVEITCKTTITVLILLCMFVISAVQYVVVVKSAETETFTDTPGHQDQENKQNCKCIENRSFS